MSFVTFPNRQAIIDYINKVRNEPTNQVIDRALQDETYFSDRDGIQKIAAHFANKILPRSEIKSNIKTAITEGNKQGQIVYSLIETGLGSTIAGLPNILESLNLSKSNTNASSEEDQNTIRPIRKAAIDISPYIDAMNSQMRTVIENIEATFEKVLLETRLLTFPDQQVIVDYAKTNPNAKMIYNPGLKSFVDEVFPNLDPIQKVAAYFADKTMQLSEIKPNIKAAIIKENKAGEEWFELKEKGVIKFNEIFPNSNFSIISTDMNNKYSVVETLFERFLIDVPDRATYTPPNGDPTANRSWTRHVQQLT
jgi:hypothetical protein